MTGSRIVRLAVAGAALVLAYAAAPRAAPAPVPSPGVKWVYGELHCVELPGRLTENGLPLAPETSVTWDTAEDETTAAGWEDLAKRLKAPPPRKDAPGPLERLRVFDRLGADGWELAAYQPRRSGDAAEVWTFKRKSGN